MWALFWVTSTSVTLKKDDSMCGTKHSPMATRESLLWSIFFFPHVLEIAQSRGLIVFLSIYPWLKHVISIALLMSLRTWGSGPFRAITQQYASSSCNLLIDETRTNVFPVGCPTIQCLVLSCSNFMTTTDFLLTRFVRWLNSNFSYTKLER